MLGFVLMRDWQYKPSATLLLVILLPMLLIILATLQYRWLTEISRSERERLQTRLQTDAQRFAQEFNAEISKAYFIFQLDAQVWEGNSSDAFAERFDLWNSNAAFPNIISEIYFVDRENSRRFDPADRDFKNAELPDNIGLLRDRLLTQLDDQSKFTFDKTLIDETVPSLTVPIFKSSGEISAENRMLPRQTLVKTLSTPEGFVILKFDREALTSEMLPELFRRNFAADAQDYNFSVISGEKTIFQSARQPDNLTAPDAAISFFDLSAEAVNIVVLSNGFPGVAAEGKRAKIVRERIDRQDAPVEMPGNPDESQLNSGETRKIKMVRKDKGGATTADDAAANGLWLLSVRHADGSLENFVGVTKWRNLGLSFGVLTLLATSVILLLLSAQRSKRAAQRQFDFVSSVSHEFRTPVSVIRSAGANLARGIVRQPAQVEKYGDLINREGERIGEMVEHILEFAGARSAGKNYVFKPVAVAPLVEQVLSDSRSFLEENKFVVEKHFAAGLPLIEADEKALRRALENLIGNAVKYSADKRRIMISAVAEGEYVLISIKDNGIGIEGRELKNIFEPFYRGREAVAGQIRGNGLGLSLVKQIVDAHRGEINAESERGEGSKFTIKIPSELKN